MRAEFTLFLAALMLPALIQPAHAGSTAWAEDPGGRMRVVFTEPEADGTIRAALQVEPADGFITYWREPGESGIPPQITVNGDSDVQLATIAYPVPKRIRLAGVTDMGYDGPVTFPLTLKAMPGSRPDMEISTFIGLCRDICIPFQASFDIPRSGYDGSAVDAAILAVAATMLPEAPSSDFRVDSARKSGDTLKIALTLPDAQDAEITLASSDGFIVEAPEGVIEAGLYTFEIAATLLPGGAQSLDSNWLLLAKSAGRAMETTLVFTADAP